MADTSKSSTPNGTATGRANLLQLATQMSKFKQRSLETAREHETLLNDYQRAPEVVLLGHSLIERMTTTGKWQNLSLWPSEAMWMPSEAEQGTPAPERLSGVLAAGCGGDKIQNILYRLVGQEGETPEQTCPSLLRSLAEHNNKVMTWMVQAGTNDLHKKKGLTDASVEAMRVLLMLLLENASPDTHILVTALFYRKDIADELVEQGNTKLKALVQETIANPRMHFAPMPEKFDKESHLEDHVHLNLEGYWMWMHTLFPQLANIHTQAYSDASLRPREA